MVFVIPLIALTLGGAVGWICGQRRLSVVVWALAAALVAAMGWAIWMGRQSQGFDGIGYAIFAMLMCLPALLGLAVGALVAVFRRRRKVKT